MRFVQPPQGFQGGFFFRVDSPSRTSDRSKIPAAERKSAPAVSQSPKSLVNPVHFYERGAPYYEFTNFAAFPIRLDGKEWPTSEHYFQAAKFSHSPELMDSIRKQPSPRAAFDVGRARSASVRKDWAEVKDAVMRRAVFAKFNQHESLRKLLLGTGYRDLVEHTTKDSYWGDNGDGTGMNKLGQTLMTVRAEMQSSVSKVSSSFSSDASPSAAQSALALRSLSTASSGPSAPSGASSGSYGPTPSASCGRGSSGSSGSRRERQFTDSFNPL